MYTPECYLKLDVGMKVGARCTVARDVIMCMLADSDSWLYRGSWQWTALPSVRNVISCVLVHCTSSSSHAVLLKSLCPLSVFNFAHLCFYLHFTVINLVFRYVTLYFFNIRRKQMNSNIFRK